MMAKWYQRAVAVFPPTTLDTEERMFAIPTASEGAPPVRAMRVSSPISSASWAMCSGVTTNPDRFRTSEACSSAAGVVFIAK